MGNMKQKLKHRGQNDKLECMSSKIPEKENRQNGEMEIFEQLIFNNLLEVKK